MKHERCGVFPCGRSPLVPLVRGRWRAGQRPATPRGLFLAAVCIILSSVVLASGPARAEERLAFSARVAGDSQRTRLVVGFDRKPEVAVHYVDSPPRIVVDLPDTTFALDKDDLKPRGIFNKIRFGAMGPAMARIVLSADQPVRVDLKSVTADEDGASYRLVLDVTTVDRSVFDVLLRNQDWSSRQSAGSPPVGVAPDPDRAFTVVIDPGHGGIDSGTVGVSDTMEKNVVLAFAKTLRDRLQKKTGVEALLTRTDDTFLTLGDRVRFARSHHAALFISVHADTVSQHSVRGATVYTLSDKASDRMAARLARQENEADAVAGVTISDEPDGVADILIDLTRRETKVFSIGLAERLVEAFKGKVGLIKNPHRYAGFRVLEAPDVPSLLIELGYLSNSADEKLLTDPDWRASTADVLAGAIDKYRMTVMASGN